MTDRRTGTRPGRGARRAQVLRHARGARGIDLTVAARRGHRDPRPVGLRQVDAAARDQPPGEGRPRAHPVDGDLIGYRRRATSCTSCSEKDDPAPAHPDRLRLPELQPVPAPDRAGERHRGADLRAAAGREARSRPRLADAARAGRAVATRPTPTRGSCPAGSSSASPSPGRSRSSPKVLLFDEPTSRARPRARRRGARRHPGPRRAAAPRWSSSRTRSASPARSPTPSSSWTAAVIVEQGPPARCSTHPQHARTRAFLSKVLWPAAPRRPHRQHRKDATTRLAITAREAGHRAPPLGVRRLLAASCLGGARRVQPSSAPRPKPRRAPAPSEAQHRGLTDQTRLRTGPDPRGRRPRRSRSAADQKPARSRSRSAPYVPPLGSLADDEKTPIGNETDIAQLVADALGLEAQARGQGVGRLAARRAVRHVRRHHLERHRDRGAQGAVRLLVLPQRPARLLVRADSDITEITEAKDIAGLTVAVGSGTNQEKILLRWNEENEAAGSTPAEVEYFETTATRPSRCSPAASTPRSARTRQPPTRPPLAGGLQGRRHAQRRLARHRADRRGHPQGQRPVDAVATALNNAIEDGTYAEVLERWGLQAEAVTSRGQPARSAQAVSASRGGVRSAGPATTPSERWPGAGGVAGDGEDRYSAYGWDDVSSAGG